MAAIQEIRKPNMAALEGEIGRSIFETVRDAPRTDWKRLRDKSRAIEKEIAEALKHARP